MVSDTNLTNDEIDIRELIQTLFRYKWIILGITLVVAVAVFVYSKYGSPRMYSTQAQVIITKPLFTTNLETRIQGTPQMPEASVLKELALDNELLWKVYTSADVSAVLDQKINFEQFKTRMSAKLTGTSKLLLAVNSSEPTTSAMIANSWADKFTAQINSLYSVNEKSMILISDEVLKARQKWDSAEQALLQKLPDGIVDTRKIELENKKNTLATYLNKLTQLDIITRDAQSLQLRLAVWPDNSQLGIEYQLSLLGLYQRATGGLEGLQVQIVTPTSEGVRTVAEAKASLDALITSLGTQREQLKANQGQLQQDITSATLALESANYQLIQLTTERDLAYNAYQALSAQLEEVRIDLAREDVIAKVAGRALPIDQPVSNRTLMKTLSAAALAFALSCFGVLFINWWKAPALVKGNLQEHNQQDNKNIGE